jgi:hypothetical protein
MGVDIYLQSILKPFEEKLSQVQPPLPSAFESFEAFVSDHFDKMRASGGYFRNGYNAGDVMWAMGLSWDGTVKPMLNDERDLPIPRARDLIEMIEARPLTRERVAAHIFEHMTDGINEHPITGPLERVMEKVMADEHDEDSPPKLSPPDVDHLFGFLDKRRNELLAILRRSTELNEPLFCDL